MDTKVKSLSQLHSALVNCRWGFAYPLAADEPYLSGQEIDDYLIPLFVSLQTAQNRARIFLDPVQQQAAQDAFVEVNKALEFIQATAQGEPKERPEPVEIDEFAEETQKAMEVLREEINRPIEKFER